MWELPAEFHVLHMEMALEEAARAADADEVPVGCVLVSPSRGVLARAHNQRETLQDPTAHAEMIAITQAATALGSWRLDGCILYVTLEPCPMCAGAMVQARIERCVYGARDPKKGADGSVYQVLRHAGNNHRVSVVEGVLAAECGEVLSEFFRGLRASRRMGPARDRDR